jgi:septal ring factor EnvC (AmiA/AmiB activator)
MEFFIEHWRLAASAVVALASLIASPLVAMRWLKGKRELAEMQVFVQKNQLIRDEIERINAELSRQAKRIHSLELELYAERLKTTELEHENKTLRQKNRSLMDRLSEYEEDT